MKLKIISNCEIGGCDNRSRTTCKLCEHYIPSPGSKYFYCLRYLNHKIICNLPPSACFECEHYMRITPSPGRDNLTGVYWKDEEEVAKYRIKKEHELRRLRANVILPVIEKMLKNVEKKEPKTLKELLDEQRKSNSSA